MRCALWRRQLRSSLELVMKDRTYPMNRSQFAVMYSIAQVGERGSGDGKRVKAGARVPERIPEELEKELAE